MTILNNDLLGNYLSITPVKVTFTDSVQANALTCSIVSDNLTDACVVRYNLYYFTTSGDTPPAYNAQLMSTNTLVVSGTDYTNWTGDNTFVYSFVAAALSVTLL